MHLSFNALSIIRVGLMMPFKAYFWRKQDWTRHRPCLFHDCLLMVRLLIWSSVTCCVDFRVQQAYHDHWPNMFCVKLWLLISSYPRWRAARGALLGKYWTCSFPPLPNLGLISVLKRAFTNQSVRSDITGDCCQWLNGVSVSSACFESYDWISQV